MKQKWKRYSASFLALLLCVTLFASTAFAAGGALGADRNGTPYAYVIGYMYSGSSQTVNTREIFTSPNNYDIWLCPVCGRGHEHPLRAGTAQAQQRAAVG